jgi:hypothetical protein
MSSKKQSFTFNQKAIIAQNSSNFIQNYSRRNALVLFILVF